MPIDRFVAVVGDATLATESRDAFSMPGAALLAEGPRSWLAVDDQHVVAFVGRIDNAVQIRLQLHIDGETVDPARLFLLAWKRWGARAVDKIIGCYGGAVLNCQNKHLTAFRDITAGTPVYLTTARGSQIAGSDLNEVARWSGRSVAACPIFAASYLQNWFFDASVTPFRDVAALAPGYVGIYNGQEWQQSQAASWHVRSISHRHFDDYVEEFTEHLDEAVRCRIEGHSRVGVSLSGGMDSTNVLASGIHVAPDIEWISYAIPFDEPDGDERSLQRAVAEYLGSPIQWVSVEGRGPLGNWSGKLFAGRPVPPTGGNWFFAESVAEAATADGAGVVYDGEDADSQLTLGRGHLPDLFVRGRWLDWWHQARHLQHHARLSMKSSLHFSLRAQLPPVWSNRLGGWPEIAKVSTIVSPQLASGIDLADRLANQAALRLWAPTRRFRAERQLVGAASTTSDLAISLGTAYRSTRTVDAHPFQDRRLMTYCMGLPWEVLFGDGSSKPLLRALSAQRLPAEFNAAVRKARLRSYYDAAVFDVERDAVMLGLDVAARYPEFVNGRELPKLRRDVETGADSWMPSRVAMLMLWIDQLSQGSATHQPI